MKRTFLALVAVVVALVPAPAEARHRRPPAAKLVTGDTVQWGHLGTYCWSYADAGSEGGQGMCVDAVPFWPRAKAAESGALTRIRFRVPGCPSEADLTWWNEVDEDGFPVGEGRQIEARKKRVRRGDEVVACRLWFRLPERQGHMYLDLFTRWDRAFRYRDGTGGGGDADYTFHLRLSP